MSKPELGRLKKLDLREYWEREDTHFTPWLAEDENISELSKEIGIELEVQDQETRVGPFRADILCRNTQDDSLVLIENQLEKTDHTHLGQLLTYAAGLDAVTLVWIVQSFTEEHRAAFDWLNRITDEKFHFFGLEIELWSIGDSDAAPKFNVVAKPNDWSKTVKEAADTVRSKLTPWQQTQMDFWSAFGAHLEAKGVPFKRPKPSPNSWMGYGLGKAGAHLIVGLTKTEAAVFVEINNRDHLGWFSELQDADKEIENELGFSLEWQKRPDKKYSFIKTAKSLDMTDKDQWIDAHDWMADKMQSFKKVFPPRLKNLSDEAGVSEGFDD